MLKHEQSERFKNYRKKKEKKIMLLKEEMSTFEISKELCGDNRPKKRANGNISKSRTRSKGNK